MYILIILYELITLRLQILTHMTKVLEIHFFIYLGLYSALQQLHH